MLMSRLPDGSLLIELTGRQFTEKWTTAAKADKVVLDDQRPAVRAKGDLGTTYYTILGRLWEVLRARPRGQAKVENRVMRCDACGADMKLTHEYDGGGKGVGCWTFACDVCKSREIWSKDIVGGTARGGERETL